MYSTLHREDTDAKSSHLLIHFTYGISPDHVVPLTCGLRTQPIVVVAAAQVKVLIFFSCVLLIVGYGHQHFAFTSYFT
jgi:hypothetical protein